MSHPARRYGLGVVSSARTVLDLTLAALPSAPRDARRAVADTLSHHARCGDILVCVSEAVTNAVVHAATAVRVVVQEDGPLVRVEVTDGDPTKPVARDPDDRTPTGRGILLIDRLAEQWGVEVRADGKTLWFELAS